MTVGTIADMAELANGASCNIKPSISGEWIIHNIYMASGATHDVYFTDGTHTVHIGTFTDSWTNMYSHVTYTNYMYVVNNSGATADIAYDGVSVV